MTKRPSTFQLLEEPPLLHKPLCQHSTSWKDKEEVNTKSNGCSGANADGLYANTAAHNCSWFQKCLFDLNENNNKKSNFKRKKNMTEN